MREIKFRFYSNLERKMYNDLTLIGLNTTCSKYDDPPVYNPLSVVEESGGTRVQHYSDGHLMQYAGIKDKDGTEVFECDIIECLGWEGEHYEVEFIDCAFYAKLIKRDVPPPWRTRHIKLDEMQEFCVIGNTHEKGGNNNDTTK